ncbi:hypothetical protein N7490_004704 [Penicillium lividum]|nr:hypothetical protein N7490_004704 [Penicillium lividum]
MVDFTNDLAQSISSKSVNLSWIHMPVPKSRDDPAYFEALKRLTLGDKTKLYLGLVHANDKEGTHRRLQAAQSIIPGKNFGIATECGMGRTPKEDLSGILQISKNLTREVESSL